MISAWFSSQCVYYKESSIDGQHGNPMLECTLTPTLLLYWQVSGNPMTGLLQAVGARKDPPPMNATGFGSGGVQFILKHWIARHS